MSIETWKQEFYPVPASANMTDKEAIEHAILKWEGFEAKNRKKHKLNRLAHILIDEHACEFIFGIMTCSLCLKYFNNGCNSCPFSVQGYNCKNIKSPYRKAMRGNPSVLIAALKECLILENQELKS